MTVVRRLLVLTVLVFTAAAGSAFASAANIYITQSGSPSGNCTAGVQTPAFFNAAANWGTGASQIGPGTTVLLCGTFTFSAGTTGLTVQGSGTSASPITILFDTGAILQSTAFGGNPTTGASGAGIYFNGVSYVTVNGQNTGIIQNTANGSPGQSTCVAGACTVQDPSVGIWAGNTTGVIIENLTIRDIYMDLAGEQTNGQMGAAWNSADIYAGGPNTSLSINGNTLDDSHVGAWVSFDGGSTTANIFNNTIAHHGWQISAANGSSCTASATINVYGNNITNWNDWNGAGASSYHTDGIIEYTRSTGCTAPTFNPQIYNNNFHGDLDGGTGSGTAYIYCSNDTGGSTSFPNSTCTAFNNVIDMSAGGNTHGAAAIWVAGQGSKFYNNTIIGPSTITAGNSAGFVFGGGVAAQLKNNILSNLQFMYFDPGPYGTIANEIAASNNNDFYNCMSTCFAMATSYSSVSAWQSGSSQDSSSVTGNPQLTSYVPQTGSAANGTGTNLNASLSMSPCCSSLAMAQAAIGLNALPYDASLSERPVTAAWTMGAYGFGNGATVAPPTGLVATVQP